MLMQMMAIMIMMIRMMLMMMMVMMMMITYFFRTKIEKNPLKNRTNGAIYVHGHVCIFEHVNKQFRSSFVFVFASMIC